MTSRVVAASRAREAAPIELLPRRAWRFCAALILTALAAGAVACGDPPPPAAPRKENVASWADVFEGTPDIYAVVRPQALKRDGLYGSFWKSLLRVAQARGFTRGTTMVEAAEATEEIIVGLNKGIDAALVFRGVPASFDPQKIADAEGRPLFRPVNDRSKVLEYELLDRRTADAGGLFVLPDRTWVGALGDARARARQAFAAPVNRPAPKVDADALAAVRFGGPIAHLLDRHPMYGLLSRKLLTATFTLKPGKGGLVIELLYEENSATAYAEMQGKRIVEELSKDEKRFGWLKGAKVAYEGNSVFFHIDVPPRLLEELPSASGADFGL
jgi:hypothetical protein